MKIIGKFLTICLIISFLAACGTAPATKAPVQEPQQPAATEVATQAPTEAPVVEAPLTAKEEWLKANQLGQYDTGEQDWAAIEEAAKKEGSVIVYAKLVQDLQGCRDLG